MKRYCENCEKETEQEIQTETEYSDGSDEPNTSNELIQLEYFYCLECGESEPI